MTQFNWKIIGIESKDGAISKVDYYLSASDDKNTVDTQGNWVLANGKTSIKFDDLKEKDIIQMIDSEMTIDGINTVKSCLENQLIAMQSVVKTELPWLANTFTPGS